jgi:pimeloyl-ACP methyl ester carboxylesterase
MLYYKTIINKKSTEWIVLIHGFGGSSTIFYKQIHPFSYTHNLLLVDLKGHGHSSAEQPLVSEVKLFLVYTIAVDRDMYEKNMTWRFTRLVKNLKKEAEKNNIS